MKQRVNAYTTDVHNELNRLIFCNPEMEMIIVDVICRMRELRHMTVYPGLVEEPNKAGGISPSVTATS